MVGGRAGFRSRDGRAVGGAAGAVWVENADSRAAGADGAPSPARWIFGLSAACAILFLLALVTGFFRPAPATNLTADYAREMTSFIRLSPQLDIESNDFGEIKTWLVNHNMSHLTMPDRLAALHPLGCRVLSFRGQDVTLICFESEGNRLAHLFVVDRAALPQIETRR